MQVVKDLVRDSRKKQSCFIKKKEAELKRSNDEAAIICSVSAIIASQSSIWSAKQLRLKTKEMTNVQVSTRAVLNVLKTKMKLNYRKIKRVAHAGNSERCKVLRHLYARKMFQIYKEDRHVVNIDESWVPHFDFRRRCWNRSG